MLKKDLQAQHDKLVDLVLRSIEYENGRFRVKGEPHDNSAQQTLQTLRATANLMVPSRVRSRT